MADRVAALSLDVDQLIDARPGTVFHILTDPVLYGRWFGPPGSTVTVEEMELTLGGRLLVRIDLPGGATARIEGFYEVIDPPVRLVHTWRGGRRGAGHHGPLRSGTCRRADPADRPPRWLRQPGRAGAAPQRLGRVAGLHRPPRPRARLIPPPT